MNLHSSLKSQGIIITEGMDATEIVDIMKSMPTILNSFPEVKAVIDTMQSIWESYLSAVSTLEKLESSLKEAEEHLAMVKDLYDMYLQLPGAYTGTGVGAVSINPMPSIQIGYTTIALAQKALDEAQKLVEQAKSTVLSWQSKIEYQKEKIISKLIDTKVV